MTEPQPDAAEAEATGAATATVTFDGETYEIPALVDDLDIDAMEAAERGQALSFVEAVLGPPAWRKLKARYRAGHGGRFPASAIAPLGDQIAEVYGFKSLGESAASSD